MSSGPGSARLSSGSGRRSTRPIRAGYGPPRINPKTGYGQFARRHGEGIDAHRFSYELAHGAIPAGYDVHHTCHVRACVTRPIWKL